MNKEEITELAADIRIGLSDKENEDIAKNFGTLEKMLDFFNTIDTEGVEEMIYPFETPMTYFREDEVSDVISQEDALKNVAKTKQGHIVVPKVVK